MQAFEDYIKSNYKIPNTTSCGITYNYTTRNTQDKKSKVYIKNHVITMKLTWFDKDNKQLYSERIVFQNDTLTKASEKHCHTISPTEVTNQFRVAKPYIIQTLIKIKQTKLESLYYDIALLNEYNGVNNDIIPPVMKNTMQIVDNTSSTSTSKTTFDM